MIKPAETQSHMTRRRLILLLVLGCVVLNLAVDGVLVWVLRQSRIHYEESARTNVSNLSKVLEQNVLILIKEMDLTLRTVVDEEARVNAITRPDNHLFMQFLDKQSARLPDIVGLRVIDQTGDTVYGTNVATNPRVNEADREHFIRVKDDPNAELVITGPILGRVTKQWVLIFSRRVSRPDGSFGGEVHASVAIDTIRQIFSAVDMGPHGVVSMWDKTTTLARYPEEVGGKSTIGSKQPSQQLKALLDSDTKTAFYSATAPTDNVKKSYAMRKVGQFPLWVIAGAAEEDYLVPWNTEARQAALAALLFAVITLIIVWQIYRYWLVGQLIRDREEQLNSAQALAHIGSWVKDLHSGQHVWSDEVFRIFGYSPQSFVPDDGVLLAAVHPDDKKEVIEMLGNLSQLGRTLDMDFQIVQDDGSARWLHIEGRAETSGSGMLDRVKGFIRDITLRKRAEEAIIESEEKYRTLFENATDAIFIISADGSNAGRIVSANNAAARMHGYEIEELNLIRIQDLATHETAELAVERLRRLSSGEQLFFETQHVRKDGSVFPVEVNAGLITIKGHKYVLAFDRDISEHKRTDEDLKRSFSLLQATLESTADGILVVNDSGKIVSFNARFTKMWSLPGDILTSGNDQQAVEFILSQLKNSKAFLDKVQQLYDHPEMESFDVLECRDGRVFERYSKPQRIGHQTVGRVCSFRDVTERKVAHEALRESERKYRELVENANSIILRWNPCGEITFLNEFGQKFFGYLEKEILGRNVLGTIVPDSESTGRYLRPLMESICENPATFEQNVNENMLRDGRRVWIAWTNKAVCDIEGKLIEVLSIGTDVTERKQAEEQIICSLREKEVLLKEIHHRVKNNMQVIYSLLSLQAEGITDESVRAKFEESRNKVYSMALIHESLYHSADLAHIDFKEYLKSLVSGIVENYKRNDVIYSVDMESIALDVNVGIPCGLIVNELVSNSLKYAFPDGGNGMIRVGININSEGNYVLFVEDSGTGIPNNVDFFNSSSLGLQLINALAKQIHGTIELLRAEGTKVSITFPHKEDDMGTQYG